MWWGRDVTHTPPDEGAMLWLASCHTHTDRHMPVTACDAPSRQNSWPTLGTLPIGSETCVLGATDTARSSPRFTET